MEEESKNVVNENLKETVIARIESQLPSDLKLSIGSDGSLSKEEMIEHVKREDNQGRQIIDMHLNFMKAVASGELIRELNTV